MSDYYSDLESKARSGDTDAQKELAYFYLEKNNRKRSYLKSQAFDYFRMAASTEDPESQYLIGFLYLNGIGRNKNSFIADQWFEKARKGGVTKAPKTLKKLFKGTKAQFPDDIDDDENSDGKSIICDNDNDTPAPKMDDTAAPEANDDTSEQPKNNKPLCFRDIAFKKDENGNDVVEVVTKEHFTNYNSDKDEADDNEDKRSKAEKRGDYQDSAERWREDGDDEDRYSSSDSSNSYGSSYESSYDSGLYDKNELTVHKIDAESDPFEKLDALVALSGVKTQIMRTQKRMQFDTFRSAKGLKSEPQSNHFIFTGNPGTGKNEVARILGHILHNIGVLEKGHVVEVDCGDLVGAWVGHSALKTKAAIKRAQGGVLFIDEAYALDDLHGWGFGGEVIATIMKAMEDGRDDFIVVMAGYKDEMKYLLKSNPGMPSRFRHHIDFEDYSAQEMQDIFLLFASQQDYKVHKDAKTALLTLMKAAVKREDKFLGNGRFARNAIEHAIENMAVRVMMKDTKKSGPNKRDLQNILFSDIPTLDDVLGNAPKPKRGSEVVDF